MCPHRSLVDSILERVEKNSPLAKSMDYLIYIYLYHMFWSCQKLLEYWGSIFETFSKMFVKTIVLTVLTVIFEVLPFKTII